MSADTTDDEIGDPELPGVDEDAVATGAAADSSEADERFRNLPRLLRYAMLVSTVAQACRSAAGGRDRSALPGSRAQCRVARQPPDGYRHGYRPCCSPPSSTGAQSARTARSCGLWQTVSGCCRCPHPMTLFILPNTGGWPRVCCWPSRGSPRNNDDERLLQRT